MPSPGFSGGRASSGNGHQEPTKLGLIDRSRGMGNDALEPKVASLSESDDSRSEGEPMQTGFVRLGGMSLRLELRVSLARKIMATGILYPSTRDIS